MKHTLITHIISIVFSLPILFGFNISYAQTNEDSALAKSVTDQHFMSFCILGGVSLPVGAFAGIDNAEYGFAKSGYTFSAEYSLPINNILYWCSLISYSSNPLDEESIRRRFLAYSPEFDVNIENYSTLFPMTGIGIHHKVFNRISIFGEIQIGWLFVFEPEISISRRGNLVIDQKASNVNAFSYGLSFGVQIFDNFKFSARYLAGKPNYKVFLANGWSDISIIQLTAGVGF